MPAEHPAADSVPRRPCSTVGLNASRPRVPAGASSAAELSWKCGCTVNLAAAWCEFVQPLAVAGCAGSLGQSLEVVKRGGL